MAIDPNTNINNVFAHYVQDDVDFCDVEDVIGGIQPSEIYFCHIKHIDILRTPLAKSTNNYAGTILNKIICKENTGFSRMKSLVESAELTSEYQNTKDSSDLELFLLGTRAELIGVSRKFRHQPFIIIVKDENNKQFVIGTLASPAYLRSFEITTGKKFDDNSGGSLKFRSNTIFFEYKHEIPIKPTDIGDYNDDYNDDYD